MVFDDINDEVEYIMHVGTSLASGRYPLGSGENAYQHDNNGFLSRVKQYENKGMSEVEIAKAFNMTTTAYRAQKSIEVNAKKRHDIELCRKLRDKGMSPTAIAERTGIARTTVNGYLKEPAARKASVLRNTADALKAEVDAGRYINISAGSETSLGVSATRMKNAVKLLEEEGYTVRQVKIKNIFDNNTRTITMLCPPETTQKDAWEHRFEARPPRYYTDNGGETYKEPPKGSDIKQFDSKRITVRYAEEGGVNKDGVIELRRGVDGLSLGGSNYAQVRIAVDGTHYAKGMAVYADDLPDGYDIRINSNKHLGTPLKGSGDQTVLKPQKSDPNNPFGAITQTLTAKGYGEYLNIVNEQGTWEKWSKTLAAQFLSKQPVSTAKKQLQLAYLEDLDEYNDICSLTNPVIKKKLLQEFADECDSKAVHLKAAAFPRQTTNVILPLETLSDKEIFAPRYENGEEVICVRYPHEGVYQIPTLIVNNRNKEGRTVIGTNSTDAVGINAKTASVLSGADFDGDTVLVIPTKGLKLTTKEPLAGLKDFDAKEAYPGYAGMKVISKQQGYAKMGEVTNLLTDMTIKGAKEDELVRATKFAQVIIDANKHELDYKRAYNDLRIQELKEIYQPSPEGKPRSHPPSTLMSRAKNEVRVTNRTRAYSDDPETGEKIFYENPKYRKDYKTGKMVEQLTKSNQMTEAKDARDLSSGYPIENAYADYANKMKALGNTARKEYMATPNMKYDAEARKKYAKEVASLDAKLNEAIKNKPLEATAFLIAKQTISEQLKENPEIKDDKDAYKKLRAKAIDNARKRVGSGKKAVVFTDKEWEAVQAGAISGSKLTDLIANSKSEDLKQRAMPRTTDKIPTAKLQLAERLKKSGYTWAEISERVGYSESKLIRELE